MPIDTSELKAYLSGGAANSDPAASIGGAKSSVEVTFSTLFAAASSAELAAGSVKYRCIYLQNTDPALTLTAVKAWLAANTPNANTTIDIGIGTAAISGTESAIANETTAPASVTFSAPASEGAALAIADLAAGASRSLWIRRTITAGATGGSTDTATLRFKGDTEA